MEGHLTLPALPTDPTNWSGEIPWNGTPTRLPVLNCLLGVCDPAYTIPAAVAGEAPDPLGGVAGACCWLVAPLGDRNELVELVRLRGGGGGPRPPVLSIFRSL